MSNGLRTPKNHGRIASCRGCQSSVEKRCSGKGCDRMRAFEKYFAEVDKKLPGPKKLKRFLYPVKEIKVYEGCGSLEEIGFAPKVRSGFEVLSGTKVHSFTVCGKIENEELGHIADEVRKVTSLSSFGSRSHM